MESTEISNLKNMLDTWEKEISLSQALTKSDINELKSHLLDIYDDIRNLGLNEEESFLVAISRLGKPVNWESEFKQTNNIVLTLKNIVTFLSGILYYFFCYYSIIILTKTIFFTSIIFEEPPEKAILFSKIFLFVTGLLGIFIFISILIEDDFLYRIIDKIKFKPKYTFSLLIITIFLSIVNYYINPLINNQIENYNQIIYLHDLFMYFEYFFFYANILGYIVIYIKFWNKGVTNIT